MQPNQPPAEHCAVCGARTRWDAAADYDKFVTHMRETSRLYRLRGWAELGLALVCLGAFILIFILSSGGPIFVLPGILLLGVFMLVRDVEPTGFDTATRYEISNDDDAFSVLPTVNFSFQNSFPPPFLFFFFIHLSGLIPGAPSIPCKF
jgi:hypothetical protein